MSTTATLVTRTGADSTTMPRRAEAALASDMAPPTADSAAAAAVASSTAMMASILTEPDVITSVTCSKEGTEEAT